MNALNLRYDDVPDEARMACGDFGDAPHSPTDSVRYPILTPVDHLHHLPNPGVPVSFIIEGDNYHALSVLKVTHDRRVDAIFIDPPYNTGTTEAYDNAFDDARWVSAFSARLRLAKDLLTPDGVICITIGEAQLFNTGVLCDCLFGRENRLADVVVAHNETGHAGTPFRNTHEHYLFYRRGIESETISLEPTNDVKVKKQYPKEDEIGRFAWQNLVRSGAGAMPEDRPTMCYPVYIDPATDRISLQPFSGSIEILPVDAKGDPRRWYCSPDTLAAWSRSGELRIRTTKREGQVKYAIDFKVRPNVGDRIRDVWTGAEFSAAAHGDKLLTRMIGNNPFKYPKSIHAVKRALYAMAGHKPNAIVLDFYAGSGTTAHALLMLNVDEECPGQRTFILATNNEMTQLRGKEEKRNRRICSEVCLPRVRAAIDGYDDVPGLPGNVRYFKVEFADHQSDERTLFLDLISNDSGIIQLAEEVREVLEEDEEIGIFSRHDGSKVAILKRTSAYGRIVSILSEMPGPIKLYVPTNNHDTNFSDPPDHIEIAYHPRKIISTYRRLWWKGDLAVR